MNIRSLLGTDEKYSKFNREEQNLAAIFYHLLLIDNNLNIFLKKIKESYTIIPEEYGIYFEYAYLRDVWYKLKDNETKKEFICEILDPSIKNNIPSLQSEETVFLKTDIFH